MNAQAATQSEAVRTSFFTDNGDGTVTDTRTGKLWTKATLGGKPLTFEGAQKACAELNEQKLGGRTDWCLGEVEELFLLADRTRYSPAIDTNAFPDTESDWYWSNTATPWDSSCVFVVGFSGGDVDDGRRGNEAFVRAVSRAPAGQ
jgi:hypothetical protein